MNESQSTFSLNDQSFISRPQPSDRFQTGSYKNIMIAIMKNQDSALHQVFKQQACFPDQFPLISPTSLKNIDNVMIINILNRQVECLINKYAEDILSKQQFTGSDDEYIQMMTEKVEAENHLFKISLQKSEQVIKNMKLENEYMVKQMQNLRTELEKNTQMLLSQQQEQFLLNSQRDNDKLKNQQQLNHELKAQVRKAEDYAKTLNDQNIKLKDELLSKTSEILTLKSELEALKNQMKQLNNTQSKNQLQKKLEKIGSKAVIQLNLHASQMSNLKIFNTNSSSNNNNNSSGTNNNNTNVFSPNVSMGQEPTTDFIGQQLAMAQLNDQILTEWKKNQRKFQNFESYLQEYYALRQRFDDLKRDSSSLAIESQEIQDMHDSLKGRFGLLLDKFQEYISNTEHNEEVLKYEAKRLKEENERYRKELNNKDTESLLITQRFRTELEKTQQQLLTLQNENLELKSQIQSRQQSPIKQIHQQQYEQRELKKDVSFNGAQHLQMIQQQQQQSINAKSNPLSNHDSIVVHSTSQSTSTTANMHSQQQTHHDHQNQQLLQQNLLPLVGISESILAMLSRDYLPTQQFNQTLMNNNGHNTGQMGTANEQTNQLMMVQVQNNLSIISTLVETICSNISDTIQLSEFKELSESITSQFNHSMQLLNPQQSPLQLYHQYFHDLHALFQNLLKNCLNKDIECALSRKTLTIVIEMVNSGNSGIDLTSLIKQNMDEMLELKLENTQLSQHIQTLEKQIEEMNSQGMNNNDISTIVVQEQCKNNQTVSELFKSQSLQLNKLTQSSHSNLQRTSDSQIYTNTNKSQKQQTQLYLTQLQEAEPSQNLTPLTSNQRCQNCHELHSIFEELEQQVHESKLKLDASTHIIQKLENEIAEGQEIKNVVIELAQMFEKKEIDTQTYPVNLLVDFVKDKVKRLINKYETIRKNNNEFQHQVMKELESLNYQLQVKKQKRSLQSKQTITDNKSAQQQEITFNDTLLKNNIDKFLQIFKILKNTLFDDENTSSQSNGGWRNQSEGGLKSYAPCEKKVKQNNRQISEVTQASSDVSPTPTPGQVANSLQQQHQKQGPSYLTSANLSHIPSNSSQTNFNKSSVREYQGDGLKNNYLEAEKEYKNYQLLSSVATENSDKIITLKKVKQQAQNSKRSLGTNNHNPTFGNSNSFKDIKANKENISQSFIYQPQQQNNKHLQNLTLDQSSCYDKASSNSRSHSADIQIVKPPKQLINNSSEFTRNLQHSQLHNNPITQRACNYTPCSQFGKFYEASSQISTSNSVSRSRATFQDSLKPPQMMNQTQQLNKTFTIPRQQLKSHEVNKTTLGRSSEYKATSNPSTLNMSSYNLKNSFNGTSQSTALESRLNQTRRSFM